jgi:hypothetical protein
MKWPVRMQAARLPLQREDSRPRRLSGLVRLEGWSVSEKAPLQNQFSERTRIGGPGIKRSRCQGSSRTLDTRVLFQAKIGAGKIRVVTHPALGDNRSNRAQNFAALGSSRRLLLFRRLGMKRAPGSHRVCVCSQRSERTMI